MSLADALELLDHAIISLVAVGGLEMAHMTRDEGWRFMSLGRHLERAIYVTATTSEVAQSDMPDDPALLEWLLDLSDSIITYRARYMGHAEWIAVADLLLFDRSNPRSAAFQLLEAREARAAAAGRRSGRVRRPPRRCRCGAGRRRRARRDPRLPARRLASRSWRCRTTLTLRYFSHVYEPAHATLL